MHESTNLHWERDTDNRFDGADHDDAIVKGVDVDVDSNQLTSIARRKKSKKSSKADTHTNINTYAVAASTATNTKTKTKTKSKSNTTGIGDEITPRVDNRNKTKLQRQSVQSLYEKHFQIGEDSRSPHKFKSITGNGTSGNTNTDANTNTNTSNRTEKAAKTASEEEESGDSMDCSSGPEPSSNSSSSSVSASSHSPSPELLIVKHDSTALVNNHHQHDAPDTTITVNVAGTRKQGHSATLDAKDDDAKRPRTRTPPNPHTRTPSNPKRHKPESSTTHLMIDSRGNPIVSKGLLKRARESKADNEKVLQVLMQSCGGKQRSPRSRLGQRMAYGSDASDMTLSSATLVGATIPLMRSNSLDSSVTFQTFDTDVNANANAGANEGAGTGTGTDTVGNHEALAMMAGRMGDSGRSKRKEVHGSERPRHKSPARQVMTVKSNNCESTNVKPAPKTKSIPKQRQSKVIQKEDSDDDTVRTIDSITKCVISHPKLPPGWSVKVSKSKKLPYYHHPDHGASWYCPVVKRSEIRVESYESSSASEDQSNDANLEVDADADADAEEGEDHNDDIGMHRQGPSITKPKIPLDNLNRGKKKVENFAQVNQETSANGFVTTSSKQATQFPIYCDPAHSSSESNDDNVNAKNKNEGKCASTRTCTRSLQNQKATVDYHEKYNSSLGVSSEEVNGNDTNQTDCLEKVDKASSVPVDPHENEDDFANGVDFDMNGDAEMESEVSSHGLEDVEVIASVVKHAAKKVQKTFSEDKSSFKGFTSKTSKGQSFLFESSSSEQSAIENENNSPRFLDFDQGIESDSNETNSERSSGSLSMESSKVSPISIPDEGLEEDSQSDDRIEMIRRKPHFETLTDRLKRLNAPICSLQRLPEIIAAREAANADKQSRRKTSSGSKKNKRGKVKVTMGRRKR